jgi:hypothetical protein
MAKADSLTHARLLQALAYDPDSGEFIRRQGGRGYSAGPAGSLRNDGYAQVALDGCMHLAHRLAFFYMNGAWPIQQVDHIDCVRANNSWKNLREASPKFNQQNRRHAYRNSKTGLLGASLDSQRGSFMARITIGDKNKTLGRFCTAQEAHEAYLIAKRTNHEGNTL